MQAVRDMVTVVAPPLPPTLRRIARGRLAAPFLLVAVMPDSAPRPEAPPTWESLIGEVAQQQDRGAFAALFSHFAPRIKSFMLRSGFSDADAENLAQEALLRLWHKAAQFDSATRGAEAWVFTIARNLRIDALRREKRGGLSQADEIDDEFLVDETPLADAQLEQRQGEVQVRRALAVLPADQQRVIELSFYQDRAHGEIARTLGIPLGTVKSRLRLAMAKLRNLLGDEP